MNKFLTYSMLVMLLSVSGKMSAQYLSEKGWFELDNVKGCPGLTINISYTGTTPCICGTGLCTCAFDYDGDGSYDSKANPLTHTFNNPGNYRLEIAFPDPDGSDFINIEIKEPQPPDFKLYQCGSRGIQVDILDSNFDNYVINYGDGSPEEIVTAGDPAPNHNYPNTSPRTVMVRGLDNNAFDNCSAASKNITPLVSLPAADITSISALDQNQLNITYDMPEDVLYQLYIRPNNIGAWKKFGDKISSTSTETLNTGLDLFNNFYCFRLATYDPCNNVEVSTSNVICSIDLDLSAENNVNRLNWATANPDNNFTLKRSDLLNRPLPRTSRSYGDMDIVCGMDYCYTLVGNYNNGYTSTSLEICATAFSDDPPATINNISTIVNEDNIELQWEAPAGQQITEYRIHREENNLYRLIGKSETNEFKDDQRATAQQSYCYQIGSTDACDNSNDESIITCSILLTGTIGSDNTIQLNWNEYSGYENGVDNYTIEKAYPDGGGTTVTSIENKFSEIDNNKAQQVIQYKVIANPNDNLAESVSNVLTIIKLNNIYHPNAFTPDNNGTNETFRVQGKYITTYELRIYNRWGELLFVSDNMDEGWNGQYKGKGVPTGTYAFVAEMIDMAGNKIKKTGSIILLRK